MSESRDTPSRSVFLVTKEYRRFAELCEACRRDRYIGVCSGPPGVGKTLSARHYAHWDDVEIGLPEHRTTIGADIPPDLADSHTLVYTPSVATTPRRLSNDLGTLSLTFNELVRRTRGGRMASLAASVGGRVADRRRDRSSEATGAGDAARPL